MTGKIMNSYNIYNEEMRINGAVSVLYHAIAEDENHVRELAKEKGYDIEGLTIELERINVKDQLNRPFLPSITNDYYE